MDYEGGLVQKQFLPGSPLYEPLNLVWGKGRRHEKNV